MADGPRVLLAEDEDDARHLLAQALERRGLQVRSAGDGAEALKLLRQEPCDVLISDIAMPQLDGLALLRTARQEHLLTIAVVITRFADKQRVLEALNLGADHLLEKPFSGQALHDLVVRLWQEHTGAGTGGEDHLISRVFDRRLAALPLSDGERRLVVLVLKGLPNASIASQLGIREQTVKNQLLAIYRRLGIGSRAELFHLLFPV